MSNEIKNIFQISFLPWVGDKIKESIKLGSVTFWPYFAEANQRINDPKVKACLDKFFRSYKDLQEKPVNTIIMCSSDDKDFHQLAENECNDLRNAVDALVFSAIAPQIVSAVCQKNNPSGRFHPPSSNIFELLTFNLSLDDNYFYVNTSQGIWEIGKIIFHKPLAMGGTMWKLDEKLIKGFDRCFLDKDWSNERERLFRSLEWFRLAHVEGSQVSDFSKIVMMATAFEILFDLPREGKRREFVNYIEKNIASIDFRRLRQAINEKEENWSLAGWWAWDFYDLRSRIVHGNSVSPSDLKYKGEISHLIVADLVFWECIKRELFKHKCIGDKIRSSPKKIDKTLSSESEEVNTSFVEYALGFDCVHKALGWLMEKKEPNSS